MLDLKKEEKRLPALDWRMRAALAPNLSLEEGDWSGVSGYCHALRDHDPQDARKQDERGAGWEEDWQPS